MVISKRALRAKGAKGKRSTLNAQNPMKRK